MTTQFQSLLHQFLSCGQRDLPSENDVRALFGEPLFAAFREDNPQLSGSTAEVEDELEKQMATVRGRFLREFETRILSRGQKAKTVIQEFASQCQTTVDHTAVINLALNSTYGHGRHACRPSNSQLIKSWIHPGHTLLDIGSGNCWVGRGLRNAGIRVRCFDNIGVYTNYWLQLWEDPEPGWPSASLKKALADETSVPFLCFPHREDPHTVEVVKQTRSDRFIVFPGPDLPNPESNGALKIPMYKALRARCFWPYPLPGWFSEGLKARSTSRPPILFEQDPIARQMKR